MVWKCSDVSADKVTSCPGDKLTSWQADQLPRRRSRLSGCGEKAPTLCPSSIHSSIPRYLCISNSMLIFANRPIFNSPFSHYGPDQAENDAIELTIPNYTEVTMPRSKQLLRWSCHTPSSRITVWPGSSFDGIPPPAMPPLAGAFSHPILWKKTQCQSE